MLKPISTIAALLLSIISLPTQAQLITELDITVQGSEYTAQFHVFSQDKSFNDLWDSDGDRQLAEDDPNDHFNFMPTFSGNADGAREAADAIIAALADDDWLWTTGSGTNVDSFIIVATPLDYTSNLADLTGVAYGDWREELTIDLNTGLNWLYTAPADAAWVTFTQKLPIPAVPALILSGLLLGALSRRFQQQEGIR